MVLALSLCMLTILTSLAVSTWLCGPPIENRPVGLDPGRHISCDYPKCHACCVPPYASDEEFVSCPRCPACQQMKGVVHLHA